MVSDVPVYPVSRLHTKQRRTAAAAVAIIARGIVAGIRRWRGRVRTRRHLAAMGERDLNDLGLSLSAVEYEINKPFWQD